MIEPARINNIIIAINDTITIVIGGKTMENDDNVKQHKEIPEKVRKKAAEILENESFSKEDGDEIIVTKKDEDIFFAYVKSKKKESFGQVVIRGGDLSFLYGTSDENPERLLKLLKNGVTSMVVSSSQLDKSRANVKLPVIEDDKELLTFAKKLTDVFVSYINEESSYKSGPLAGKWDDMIYYGLVLLLSQREKNEKLFSLPQIYLNPGLVKVLLEKVTDREIHGYFTMVVPLFIKNADVREELDYFNIRVASLIGEQEVQDLCRDYKENN